MWAMYFSFGFVSFWITEGEAAVCFQFQWNTTKRGREWWMYGDFGEDGPAGLGAEEQRIHGRDIQHRTGGKQGRIIVDFKKCLKNYKQKTQTASGPCMGGGSGTSARSPHGHLAEQTYFSRPCQGGFSAPKTKCLQCLPKIFSIFPLITTEYLFPCVL